MQFMLDRRVVAVERNEAHPGFTAIQDSCGCLQLWSPRLVLATGLSHDPTPRGIGQAAHASFTAMNDETLWLTKSRGEHDLLALGSRCRINRTVEAQNSAALGRSSD
jgi:hypothetical protein